MNTKYWYKSSELWASVLAVVIVVAKLAGIEPNEQLVSVLSNIYAMLYPVIITYLRLFKTDSKIIFTKEK